jgi:SNF2 family DNA or RNA helicase
MGLGKTIQMIALMISHRSRNLSVKSTLLVVPLVIMNQWMKEIEDNHKPIPTQRNSKLKVLIFHGTAKQRWVYIS